MIDLRYLNKGHYSFAAIAHLTQDQKIDHSYIGWVFTEEKLQKNCTLINLLTLTIFKQPLDDLLTVI